MEPRGALLAAIAVSFLALTGTRQRETSDIIDLLPTWPQYGSAIQVGAAAAA